MKECISLIGEVVRLSAQIQSNLPFAHQIASNTIHELNMLIASRKTEPEPHILDSISLLRKIAAVNNTDSDSLNPAQRNQLIFRKACELGLLTVVRQLINLLPTQHINIALHVACKNGHIDIVNELLEHDVKPDDFAFRLACAWGHTEIVRTLLHRNVVIDSNLHSFALQTACQNGFTDIFHLLIDIGSTTDEHYLLCVACKYGNLGIVCLLIDRDVHNSDAFYWACASGQIDIVRKLLETKKYDSEIKCALYFGCKYKRHVNVCKLLLSKLLLTKPWSQGFKGRLK